MTVRTSLELGERVEFPLLEENLVSVRSGLPRTFLPKCSVRGDPLVLLTDSRGHMDGGCVRTRSVHTTVGRLPSVVHGVTYHLELPVEYRR